MAIGDKWRSPLEMRQSSKQQRPFAVKIERMERLAEPNDIE
jgi:hypothetical protein